MTRLTKPKQIGSTSIDVIQHTLYMILYLTDDRKVHAKHYGKPQLQSILETKYVAIIVQTLLGTWLLIF